VPVLQTITPGSHNAAAANVEKLRRDLGDRLYELDQASMEAYLPADLYGHAGRDREQDLSAIEALHGDRQAIERIKREISDAIADSLTEEQLDLIPTIKQAAERAITEAR
jgi:hypothetical protein